MSSKFQNPNIAFVRNQVQKTRYSLKQFSVSPSPRSREMLNFWVQSFGYSNWQIFLRKIKGYSPSSQLVGIATKDNFESFADKLHQQIKSYNLEQIKWGVSASLEICNEIEIDSNLISRLLVRPPPSPLSQQLRDLIDHGIIDIKTQVSENTNEHFVVGYVPTEIGKYIAAHQLERNKGRYLSTIELVKLALPTKLCKLKSISHEIRGS